jgi:hypothetical protein
MNRKPKVAVLARASGRTLVLPPHEAMYLISKGNQRHGFGDFFPLEDISELKVPGVYYT